MPDEQQETEDIKRRWDRIYQKIPLESIPWEEGKPSPQLVELIQSGLVEKGPVLDICSGSGNNAVYLAEQGFTCFGIDISPTAISYARRKAAEASVTCELTAGNAITLPYPDESFTLVFDRGCFHSISPGKRKTFIRGIHRVLKQGGKYQLICFSSKDHPAYGVPYSFSPKEIRELFSPLFVIHYIRELPTGTHGFRDYFLSVLMEKQSS